ncbi:MAG: hypothetical protein K5979_03940 [Ruminococcus sp.]|nr:hypothetical protein [Ruminococcus sp.]
MDISFDYLQDLLQEINTLRDTISFQELNDTDYDEITYISNKNDTRIGVQQGYRQKLACKKNRLKEKDTIRKDCKNYSKIYKKDGKVIRVENYVKGQIDVIFIAHYTADKRFLFPFSSSGGYYPTYSYVTHYYNGDVYEEYSASKNQIVFERYTPNEDKTVGYDYINYVPNGTQPVLSRASGIVVLTPELRYYSEQYTTWRDNDTLSSDFPQ